METKVIIDILLKENSKQGIIKELRKLTRCKKSEYNYKNEFIKKLHLIIV